MKKNRNFNGLEKLFGEGLNDVINEINADPQSATKGSKTTEIEIAKIQLNPYQPRKHFDQEKMQELANSIKNHGLIQPVILVEKNGTFILVSGERRLRAHKILNLEKIPAVIASVKYSNIDEYALLENIQREDLSAIEEAHAYQQLIQRYSYTQEELAKRIGKSRSHIANILRLLKLPKDVQELVVNQKLSMGHVRALITLEEPTNISKLAKQAIDSNYNVRQLEMIVAKLKGSNKKSIEIEVDPHIKEMEKVIRDKVDAKVSIANSKITIKYNNKKHLNAILEKLGLIISD